MFSKTALRKALTLLGITVTGVRGLIKMSVKDGHITLTSGTDLEDSLRKAKVKVENAKCNVSSFEVGLSKNTLDKSLSLCDDEEISLQFNDAESGFILNSGNSTATILLAPVKLI